MPAATIQRLIDAKDPEAVKLWADKIYIAVLDLLGSGVGATGLAIKSIQRGTMTITGTNTSNTATITEVDTTKCELRELGQTNTAATDGSNAYLVLTNATTITATRASSVAATTTISWELTEYE